jgi:TolB protein
MKNMLVFAFFVILFALAAPVHAQQTLSVDIFGPGQTRMNLVRAQNLFTPGASIAVRTLARDFSQRLDENLMLLPFLRVVDPTSLLGGGVVGGATSEMIDFKPYQLERVDVLVTLLWSAQPGGQAALEARAYEVFTGNLIVGKQYGELSASNIPGVARAFAGAIMEALTGHGEFFEARLAFVRKKQGARNVWSVRPNGDDLVQLTDLSGYCLSPAWSPDGAKLVFTHVGQDGHRLGVWRPGVGTDLKRLQGNAVIGPAFTPEGRIALTLDVQGQPDIYLLSESYSPAKAIVQSWAIDVSPSFSADGEKMAFATGRLGNPHIFLLDVPSGTASRVTYDGKYNTAPSISPDGNLIAFSRDTPEGHRIYVHDLTTGIERQVSFGPGSDEEPAFAPDGYFLAFSSNRSGEYRLYLTTRNGDEPVAVDVGPGEAKAPSWTAPRN